jgi:hypothetical protein
MLSSVVYPFPNCSSQADRPDPLRDACHALERHFVIYQLLDNPQTSVRDISNKMGGLNLPLASGP